MAAGRKTEEDFAIKDFDVTQEVLEPAASIVFGPAETRTRGIEDVSVVALGK